MTLGHSQAEYSTLPITVCLDRSVIFPRPLAAHKGMICPLGCWAVGKELFMGEDPTLPVPMEPSTSPLMSQYSQPNSLKIQFHFCHSDLVNKDPLDTPLPHLAGIRVPRPDSKSTPTQPHCQNKEDVRWKWASSTILLSYGQMAAWAKNHILPWVDNILSRMIFYFRFSTWVQVTLFTITPVLLLPQDGARTPALPCPNCGVREAQGQPSLACAQLPCPPAKPPVLFTALLPLLSLKITLV